ncbi:MAG TPA: hypothetical protein VFS24_02890 [Steroidobacteraceae bacterium]|nr:hypothetical protein [Steroidobacteraceae bacterium]
MSSTFKLLGALLALYTVRSLATGSVYARSGIWGRTFRRDEDRLNYWGAIAAYCALSLALLFVF